MKQTLFLLFLFFTFYVGNVTAHDTKTKSVHIQHPGYTF